MIHISKERAYYIEHSVGPIHILREIELLVMPHSVVHSGSHVEEAELVVLQEELGPLLRLLFALLGDLDALVVKISDLLCKLKAELVVEIVPIFIHGLLNPPDHLIFLCLEQLVNLLCNSVLPVRWHSFFCYK